MPEGQNCQNEEKMFRKIDEINLRLDRVEELLKMILVNRIIENVDWSVPIQPKPETQLERRYLEKVQEKSSMPLSKKEYRVPVYEIHFRIRLVALDEQLLNTDDTIYQVLEKYSANVVRVIKASTRGRIFFARGVLSKTMFTKEKSCYLSPGELIAILGSENSKRSDFDL